jgi:hypothetical protein
LSLLSGNLSGFALSKKRAGKEYFAVMQNKVTSL